MQSEAEGLRRELHDDGRPRQSVAPATRGRATRVRFWTGKSTLIGVLFIAVMVTSSAVRGAPAFATDASSFQPNEAWTSIGYYGVKGTYFADVTGDGRADAI